MRLGTSLLLTAGMWLLATIAVAVYLTSWSAGFDSGEPGAGDLVGRVALVTAAVLFAGSAPVAYFVGRQKWLWSLPVLATAVGLGGVAIAGLT